MSIVISGAIEPGRQATCSSVLILLHGFDLGGGGYYMPKLLDFIESNVEGVAGGCELWQPLFNSRNNSFVDCANALFSDDARAWLQQFDKRFVVAHSMGGVIARRMQADGANFDAVVTLNTPHEGLAGWIDSFAWAAFSGPQSLLPISQDLHKLNYDDDQSYDRYHFVSASYWGPSPGIIWPHQNDNDTVVEKTSQEAWSLAIRNRYSVSMDYGLTTAPPAGPHGTLIGFPDGQAPLCKFDSSPLLQALQDAIVM